MIRNLIITVIGILSILFFDILAEIHMDSSSEAREAHISLIIHETGEWLLPTRGGVLPSKPPLAHWLAAIVRELTGDRTAFAQRLIALLAGLGVIYLTYALGNLLSKLKKSNLNYGAIAALTLSLSYGFLRLALNARVDMLFIFFSTLAVFQIAAFVLKLEAKQENYNKHQFYFFWIAAGFAFLAKGPLGIVLPLLSSFFIIGFNIHWKAAFNFIFFPRKAWLLFLLIVIPWYLNAYLGYGWAFIERQILFENLNRFVGGTGINSDPIWFYVPEFFRSAFPWSLLFIPALIYFIKTKEPKTLDRNLYVSMLTYITVTFILFSLSTGKRAAYLAPIIPPLCIFVSIWLGSLINKQHPWIQKLSSKKIMFRTAATLLTLTALILMCLILSFWYEQIEIINSNQLISEVFIFLKTSAVKFIAAITALFILMFLLFKKDQKLTYYQIAISSSLLTSLLILLIFGAKAHLKNFPETANEIRKIIKPEENLIVLRKNFAEDFDVLLFYLDRKFQFSNPDDINFSVGKFFMTTQNELHKYHCESGSNIKSWKFQQTPDRIKNKSEKGIVVFSCNL